MDGKYVVIGSKGGEPTHPGWYVNLRANPECEIRVGSKRMRARARRASGDEQTRARKKMAEMYPRYDDHQKRAGSRQIPVVVLFLMNSFHSVFVPGTVVLYPSRYCARRGRCPHAHASTNIKT